MSCYARPSKVVLRRLVECGQYTSLAFGQRCREMGVRPSMGTVGDAYDNAMAESFFATLECELIARRSWPSKAQARTRCSPGSRVGTTRGGFTPRSDTARPTSSNAGMSTRKPGTNTGCPPRQSVRRKRRPLPWTTLRRHH